ncbi:hypothetical protein [Burkholderia stagnalis]|uniref:hypothetical protein n=1 Tax=Burkholderia stagnalis TaxID=1503054 RepID=UPI001E46BCC4|nr:hypothetical protein [Burkholderia stagnalis]
MSFADVDFLNPRLSMKAQDKLVDAFTAEQAQTIRTFVEALPDEIASIVVHCEGGYSRSCAIALALHLLYDYYADLEHLGQANPSVVRVMVGDNHTRLIMLHDVEKGIGDALAGGVQTEGEFRKWQIPSVSTLDLVDADSIIFDGRVMPVTRTNEVSDALLDRIAQR